MSVSRRRFIRSAAVCALATGALLRTPLAAFGQAADAALDFPIPYEATTSPVFHYTQATFEPYLNGIFVAAGARSRTVELQLVAIRGYAPPSAALLTTRVHHRRTDCFSLLFRSAAPLSELSSIHKLEHAALGEFDLFLTESVGRGGYFYEAVINHVAS
jgi:Domain of unknown function (DUF6916)